MSITTTFDDAFVATLRSTNRQQRFALVTAFLLFGQYRILYTRALCVLGCGYLFTALTAAIHALSFPGLFSPTGLFGAGPQTTAWLYMFWHGGFPLFVIAYARLKDDRDAPRGTKTAIAAYITCTVLLIGVVMLFVTAGQQALPAIMQGNRYTPLMLGVVTLVWLFSAAALYELWRRERRSVLDLWLMVAMCAWLIDIALSAVLNGGRYDLGFYAGRLYGLLAASFLLMLLLIEHGAQRGAAAPDVARPADRHCEPAQLRRNLEPGMAARAPLAAAAVTAPHRRRSLQALQRYLWSCGRRPVPAHGCRGDRYLRRAGRGSGGALRRGRIRRHPAAYEGGRCARAGPEDLRYAARAKYAAPGFPDKQSGYGQHRHRRQVCCRAAKR
jgi:hypothetical protein